MNANTVKHLRKALGLSQTEFAAKLGVSKNTIINYEKGGTIPATKSAILEDLCQKTFNPEQGVNEVGDAYAVKMLNADEMRFKMVPLLGHRAQAGFLSGWGDAEYIEDLPKIPWEVDREYKGNYLCFEVDGDSMDNNNPVEAILEKDILLCREVQKQHWRNKLHINKWDFVIAHRERGVVVKRITEHNVETGELTLHSLNDLYADYTVNLDDVVALFNVVDLKRSRRR